MATFRELLQAAKGRVRETDPAGAEVLLAEGHLLLDVREPDEYEQGAIPGSIHIPRGNLESGIENRVVDRDQPIVVMCAGGVRSAFAADTLGQLGYTDVVSMDGGFNRWKDEGRNWSAPRTLAPDQRNRYQRHLSLPEVGEEGLGTCGIGLADASLGSLEEFTEGGHTRKPTYSVGIRSPVADHRAARRRSARSLASSQSSTLGSSTEATASNVASSSSRRCSVMFDLVSGSRTPKQCSIASSTST